MSSYKLTGTALYERLQLFISREQVSKGLGSMDISQLTKTIPLLRVNNWWYDYAVFEYNLKTIQRFKYSIQYWWGMQYKCWAQIPISDVLHKQKLQNQWPLGILPMPLTDGVAMLTSPPHHHLVSGLEL